MGVDVILRNDKGDVLFALSWKEVGLFEVDDIETFAALKGLQMILHLGFSSRYWKWTPWLSLKLLDLDLNYTRQGNMIFEIQSLLSYFLEYHILGMDR